MTSSRNDAPTMAECIACAEPAKYLEPRCELHRVGATEMRRPDATPDTTEVIEACSHGRAVQEACEHGRVNPNVRAVVPVRSDNPQPIRMLAEQCPATRGGAQCIYGVGHPINYHRSYDGIQWPVDTSGSETATPIAGRMMSDLAKLDDYEAIRPLVARINKGRAKYPNGCTVLSLVDEAGEVAHAVNKYETEERVRDELLDVAAVAMRLYYGEIDRGLETDGLVQRRRERANQGVEPAPAPSYPGSQDGPAPGTTSSARNASPTSAELAAEWAPIIRGREHGEEVEDLRMLLERVQRDERERWAKILRGWSVHCERWEDEAKERAGQARSGSVREKSATEEARILGHRAEALSDAADVIETNNPVPVEHDAGHTKGGT